MTRHKFFNARIFVTPSPRNIKTRRQKHLTLIALTSFAFLGCLHPFKDMVFQVGDVFLSINEGDEGIIWKGEAASHDAALSLWGTPKKDWLYHNTSNNCVYEYNGSQWVMIVNGNNRAVETNLQIAGGYAADAYVPVRMYFTDGTVADGYIDRITSKVMLYEDEWYDPMVPTNGLIFHTLRLLAVNNNILLSRSFDPDDPIYLNINAQGKLQFRQAIQHPTSPDGLEYHPIDTAGELALMGREDALGGKYVLMRNIDLLGAPSGGLGILVPNPHNWKPIGDDAAAFAGIFDADDKLITNLYINGGDGVGLFGEINGAKLKHIILTGNVNGGSRVGGIAGWVKNGSEITGCSFSGTLSGNGETGGIAGVISGSAIDTCANYGTVIASSAAGGVAGWNSSGTILNCDNRGVVSAPSAGGVANSNSGTIARCANYGEVTSTSWWGGVAGGVVAINNSGGIITHCNNEEKITGSNSVGGVAGKLFGGEITACYNVAEVLGSGEAVGGIAGGIPSESAITACYNTGSVMGNDRIGGIAGDVENNSSVTACYNIGTITGTARVGGVAGRLSMSDVKACYNAGAVSGNSYVGGAVGQDTGSSTTIANCFWLNLSAAGLNPASTNDGGGATVFSDADPSNWPQDDNGINWGADGSDKDGNYWWALGSWSNGDYGRDSTFPKLWWENPAF